MDSSDGGDGTIGHHLTLLLREAGFGHIQPSASWEQPSSLDEWPQFYAGWSQVFSGNIANIMLGEGWIDKKRLNQIVSAWRNFGENKTGFAASPWIEAVGWRV